MYYTIYQITNTINGKIYIGKHQTKNLNDGYMGSGKHLKRAIAKHGVEHFRKEILFQFDNEAEMTAKEVELVTEEFASRRDTYNIRVGGRGGFEHVFKTKEDRAEHNRRVSGFRHFTPEQRQQYCAMGQAIGGRRGRDAIRERHPEGTFKGRTHTTDWKERHAAVMRVKSAGQNNSQYGTMWITDEVNNAKLPKDSIIPAGWRQGRC